MTPKEREVSESVSLIARLPKDIAMGKLMGWKTSELQCLPCWLCNCVGKNRRSSSPAFSPCREILHSRLPAERAASSPCSLKHKGINVLVQCMGPLSDQHHSSSGLLQSLSLSVRTSQPNCLVKGAMATVKPQTRFLADELCWFESVVEY